MSNAYYYSAWETLARYLVWQFGNFFEGCRIQIRYCADDVEHSDLILMANTICISINAIAKVTYSTVKFLVLELHKQLHNIIIFHNAETEYGNLESANSANTTQQS